jgi:hypothetical protein
MTDRGAKGRPKTLAAMSLVVVAALSVVGCERGATSDSVAPEAGKSAGTSTKAKPSNGGGGILAAPKPEPITLPEGTTLPIILETSLSSKGNNAGDAVVGKLADDVRVGDKVVIPASSEVRGHVTAAEGSGRVKGRARLAFEFDSVVVKGKEHSISTQAIDITADNGRKRDAGIIGGGAGAGAIVGAITNGKKGAGLGALIGAGAGTGVVLATKGGEVELGAGGRYAVSLTREVRL